MHASLLYLHIATAALALLAGTAGLLFAKGSRTHRINGTVFFAAMMIMGASAIVLAIMKAQTLNALVGALTCYLVTTAWLAGRDGAGKGGAAVMIALVAAVLIGILFVTCGAQSAAQGAAEGEATGGYFFFGFISWLAAALDARFLLRGIDGAHRIARHLWRMCLPLAIAVISVTPRLYTLFPHLSKSLFLQLGPVTAVLVIMVYWLCRVLWSARRQDAIAT